MATPQIPAAIQIVMLDQAPEPRPQIAKRMAYGPSSSSIAETGLNFRQDRGRPYYRGGRVVPVAPQFKGQKIAVQNSNSAILPIATTPTGSNVATVPTGVSVVGSKPTTRQNNFL